MRYTEKDVEGEGKIFRHYDLVGHEEVISEQVRISGGFEMVRY